MFDYAGTLAVFMVSVIMIIVSISVLMYSLRKQLFSNVKKASMIPFLEEEERIGEPNDQLFKDA
jgi:hypothetical protein